MAKSSARSVLADQGGLMTEDRMGGSVFTYSFNATGRSADVKKLWRGQARQVLILQACAYSLRRDLFSSL